MQKFKSAVSRALIPLAAQYMRQRSVSFGKAVFWNKIVGPRLSWRDIHLSALTESGHRFNGSLRDIIFRHLYFFGMWEPAISAYLRAVLRQGDSVIDVGANIGVHVMLASECVGPSGKIHAIEASPTIFQILEQNLATNGITNAIAYNAAVLATRRPVSIFKHDARNFGATTVMQHRVSGDVTAYTNETTVQGMPLVDVVGEAALSAARVIKIDVEGAELEVLQGLLPHSAKLRDDVEIVVECNSDSLAAAGLTRQEFLILLDDHGFTPMQLPHHYDVLEYIGEADLSPHELAWIDSKQVDILFRRK